MTTSREVLREEFRSLDARQDYAEIFLNSFIALQIKALRLQRKLTQGELAAKAGMKQSRISAMEQASYCAWSISTLRRLAGALDLALVVRFESFGTLLNDVSSANRATLERPSFSDDPVFRLEAAASLSAVAMPSAVEAGGRLLAKDINAWKSPGARTPEGRVKSGELLSSPYSGQQVWSGVDSEHGTYAHAGRESLG